MDFQTVLHLRFFCKTWVDGRCLKQTGTARLPIEAVSSHVPASGDTETQNKRPRMIMMMVGAMMMMMMMMMMYTHIYIYYIYLCICN